MCQYSGVLLLLRAAHGGRGASYRRLRRLPGYQGQGDTLRDEDDRRPAHGGRQDRQPVRHQEIGPAKYYNVTKIFDEIQQMEVVKNDIFIKLTIYHIHNVQTQADKKDHIARPFGSDTQLVTFFTYHRNGAFF